MVGLDWPSKALGYRRLAVSDFFCGKNKAWLLSLYRNGAGNRGEKQARGRSQRLSLYHKKAQPFPGSPCAIHQPKKLEHQHQHWSATVSETFFTPNFPKTPKQPFELTGKHDFICKATVRKPGKPPEICKSCLSCQATLPQTPAPLPGSPATFPRFARAFQAA